MYIPLYNSQRSTSPAARRSSSHPERRLGGINAWSGAVVVAEDGLKLDKWMLRLKAAISRARQETQLCTLTLVILCGSLKVLHLLVQHVVAFPFLLPWSWSGDLGRLGPAARRRCTGVEGRRSSKLHSPPREGRPR